MNDKIKELAEQAERELANRPKGMFSMPMIITKEKFNEKFAHLIVRECCQKLENDGMVEVAMEMKQHFGIE